jgi:selenide,water dikinase
VETGGAAHNRRFVASVLSLAEGVAPEFLTLAHDPQTSGGLLAAVPEDRLEAVEAALESVDVAHWRVGRVEMNGEPGVVLK